MFSERLLLTVNIDCSNVNKAWLQVIKKITQSSGKRVNDNNVEPVAGGTPEEVSEKTHVPGKPLKYDLNKS